MVGDIKRKSLSLALRQDRKATSGNGAFTASDINVTPTTATVTSGPTQDTIHASRYTATITPTADGDVTVSLTTAGVEDAAGNAVTSTGSTTSVTVPYDTTSPTVVVSRDDLSTKPAVNAPFYVRFDFSFLSFASVRYVG